MGKYSAFKYILFFGERDIVQTCDSIQLFNDCSIFISGCSHTFDSNLIDFGIYVTYGILIYKLKFNVGYQNDVSGNL